MPRRSPRPVVLAQARVSLKSAQISFRSCDQIAPKFRGNCVEFRCARDLRGQNRKGEICEQSLFTARVHLARCLWPYILTQAADGSEQGKIRAPARLGEHVFCIEACHLMSMSTENGCGPCVHPAPPRPAHALTSLTQPASGQPALTETRIFRPFSFRFEYRRSCPNFEEFSSKVTAPQISRKNSRNSGLGQVSTLART